MRCGLSSEAPDDATADEADAGMTPTLYVPNPMAGWSVPSRMGMAGHDRAGPSFEIMEKFGKNKIYGIEGLEKGCRFLLGFLSKNDRLEDYFYWAFRLLE